MTSRDFCYWLQGFFELRDHDPARTGSIDPGQTDLIKRHLSLVFLHEIDPSFGPDQEKLQQLHGPSSLDNVRFNC